jgi:hypothetical protein
MISAAEFGLSVVAFIWTILDYIAICNFWKSSFFCHYNAEIFLETNKT